MTLHQTSQPDRTPLLPGWTTFGNLAPNYVYEGKRVPVRMQGTFMETPWPLHPLSGSIVDTDYTPCAYPEYTGQRRTLEIVGELAVRVETRSKKYQENCLPLKLLNIFLLTRGTFLRPDELMVLSADAYERTPSSRAFRVDLQTLSGALGSGPEIIEQTRITNGSFAYQLHRDLMVTDERRAN